jgi:hypothetical protein
METQEETAERAPSPGDTGGQRTYEEGYAAGAAAAAETGGKDPSRRRALAIGGTAALAAIGAALGIHAVVSRNQGAAAPTSISCELSDAPAACAGIDELVPTADRARLAELGISANQVDDILSSRASLPASASKGGATAARYANVTLTNATVGKPYLVSANVDALTYREASRDDCPEGWKFALEKDGRAYNVASAKPLAVAFGIAIPNSETATFPIEIQNLDKDGNYRISSGFSIIGSI